MSEARPKRLFNIYNDHRGTGFAGNVWDVNAISPTLTTMGGGNQEPIILENMQQQTKQIQLPSELQGKKFRIRKLTERECFRLMDVEDADIDKIQATGISRSAQYKLAGNSIVTSVLYHIFDKLFINTSQPKETGTQLTLF